MTSAICLLIIKLILKTELQSAKHTTTLYTQRLDSGTELGQKQDWKPGWKTAKPQPNSTTTQPLKQWVDSAKAQNSSQSNNSQSRDSMQELANSSSANKNKHKLVDYNTLNTAENSTQKKQNTQRVVTRQLGRNSAKEIRQQYKLSTKISEWLAATKQQN